MQFLLMQHIEKFMRMGFLIRDMSLFASSDVIVIHFYRPYVNDWRSLSIQAQENRKRGAWFCFMTMISEKLVD